MARLTAAAFLLCLKFALAACGSPEAPRAETADAAAEPSTARSQGAEPRSGEPKPPDVATLTGAVEAPGATPRRAPGTASATRCGPWNSSTSTRPAR